MASLAFELSMVANSIPSIFRNAHERLITEAEDNGATYEEAVEATAVHAYHAMIREMFSRARDARQLVEDDKKIAAWVAERKA